MRLQRKRERRRYIYRKRDITIESIKKTHWECERERESERERKREREERKIK